MLSVAFDVSNIGINSKAHKHNKSKRTISRYQKTSAMVFLMLQYKLFTFLTQRITSGEYEKPKLLIDIVLCDETKQRLRLNLGVNSFSVSGHAQQSPHVFVAQRKLILQYATWSAEVEWIAPPYPMVSTDAGALRSVLNELPGIGSHKSYNRFFHTMLPHTDDVLKMRCVDGASGNVRYIHHEWLLDGDDDCMFGVAKQCGQHIHADTRAHTFL